MTVFKRSLVNFYMYARTRLRSDWQTVGGWSLSNLDVDDLIASLICGISVAAVILTSPLAYSQQQLENARDREIAAQIILNDTLRRMPLWMRDIAQHRIVRNLPPSKCRLYGRDIDGSLPCLQTNDGRATFVKGAFDRLSSGNANGGSVVMKVKRNPPVRK